MLRSKACEGASTIHSLIHRLDDEGKGWEARFKLNEFNPVKDANLVIIDEYSMVGEEAS